MTRGVRLYLVGSLVLVSLAGCGRGFFQAEREPWRAEAEVACLKSGAVKEGPDRVRVEPISGPGMCGADYPLKIAALGEGSSIYGFADDLRPPASIVSMLDRWFAESVQPAAMRWFGVRVVEIRQISAYSCRGMNGNPHAHISEHAFGNALDIAAFTLADGRRITVKDGWRGLPEEQGFLRDVQATACQQFNTVLAPGSNAHHEDHIHVDLMRRTSRRTICQPAAVSGEQVAARAGQRNPYGSRDSYSTGSLGAKKSVSRWFSGNSKVNEEDEFEDH